MDFTIALKLVIGRHKLVDGNGNGGLLINVIVTSLTITGSEDIVGFVASKVFLVGDSNQFTLRDPACTSR